MHLILLTRGVQRMVKEFESLCAAQRFPFKRKNLETGKEEIHYVQGALRPIQLYEYVFPEESLNDVLGSLDAKGPIKRKEIKSISWMLRKMLKLKQIPEQENITVTGYRDSGTLNGEPMPTVPVHNLLCEGVAVYPIGIKDDPKKDYDWGKDGKYNQEGL